VWRSFTDSGDWANRYGRALVELLEHLPTDQLSGKVAATIVVTLDHRTLLDQLAQKVTATDTGEPISASEARRLACNAGIVPAMLGGPSLPLDLGRQERFFTEHQRVAPSPPATTPAPRRAATGPTPGPSCTTKIPGTPVAARI
jgi:hypothetical protein